jgi:hypothetical protein
MTKRLQSTLSPLTLLCLVFTISSSLHLFAAHTRAGDSDNTRGNNGSIHDALRDEYFGDLTFTSQAEIDAFPKNYTIIYGNVTVSGKDITSLAGLGNITEIDGSLTIADNPSLANIDGLENLTYIARTLTLDNNAILTNLDGFNHLMFISLSLFITNNPLLGTCAVEAICFYLDNPVSSRMGRVLSITISDNASGCMSVEQVMAACTALPVTLVSFQAEKTEQAVLLTWKTAEEENSADFDIQRSHDGKNWTGIGRLKAAGQANSERSYSYVDSSPLKGNNLYRLKMTDLDGTFTYSSMKSVHVGAVAAVGMIAYPNPSSDQILIQVAEWSQVKAIEMVDQKGRTVYGSTGKPASAISVRHLLPGIYVIRLIMADGTKVMQRVVRQDLH